MCMREIWAYLCHPTPRCVHCCMAQLLCQLLSFVSAHLTLVAAPVFPIPLWRLCRRIEDGEGVCHLGSSDWEKLSCPSLPQQARQSHTQAGPRRDKARENKQTRQQSTAIFKQACHSPLRDFHFSYLSSTWKHNSHRQQSLNTTLVFYLHREITDFQPFSRQWEASADWGDWHSTCWRVAAWLGWARCGMSFLGALLLNIKRNRWRLHRGREACGIE